MNESTLTWPRSETPSGTAFGVVALALMLLALVLAGTLPVVFSIATVFLFAGPHNWLEARYFLARLPARWGKLTGYYFLAFAGIVALTATFAGLPYFFEWRHWSGPMQLRAAAIWNSALVGWILVLIHVRSRQNPRRDWSWTLPIGLTLAALSWIEPFAWGLLLVYAHPLMAFWILDRELRRSSPQWRRAYHGCLAVLPLLLGLLWWRLARAPSLPETDHLTRRITQHAGAALLTGVSSHLLVATHTFLEMLHYSVWLLAIPLLALHSAPWRVQTIALARRSGRWRGGVIAVLAVGGLLVFVLWACFLVDFPTTRDIYFTVAMLHVLAEVPFLLRAL
jgi:hypothetical protein